MPDLKLIPLWDCVLIEKQTQTRGGLFIPEEANHIRLQRGIIVAVGPGATKLKTGDDVFFGVNGRAGTVEPLQFGGRDYVICGQEAVIAKVEPA